MESERTQTEDAVTRSHTPQHHNLDEDDVVDEHPQLLAPPPNIHHVHMSDPPPPPKPKPGSLRDRIAAFELKPTSAPAPPLRVAPCPKPGNLSQWKAPPTFFA